MSVVAPDNSFSSFIGIVMFLLMKYFMILKILKLTFTNFVEMSNVTLV